MHTFRLDPNRPVGEEIRRLLVDGTDGAAASLRVGDRARGVHEARKACRRCRAVLWWVRAGIHASEWRPLDRLWRDAARHVGPLRDADVVPATVQAVAGDLKGLAWSPPPPPDDADARLRAALDALTEARAELERLRVDRIDRDTLVEGLRRSWREARNAMEEVVTSHEVEIVHDWRKATRRLLHHASLLRPLWPGVGGALVDELDRLQELLGAHHDLAVVGAALDRERTPPEAARALEQRLRARAADLEARACALGRGVLAPRPRTVAELLSAVWHAA